ncbi:MAG: hypothetical protein CVU57_24280 [Deltaproteobacteria bacterium HGW-Deltaproteobacteria-15]|jgi:hypothetical protein|nr:MAG: hypothetical protein CVU57_24280 [Deltaproteobacteria bacterium HGW-Deltaproteobacteria-15]
MKFCYVDESGTGDEPYAVMVGIVVDALRMRPTKADWDGLLRYLESVVGKSVEEIHTRDFYAGNGPWRDIDGRQRAEIIGSVMRWLGERKHSIIFAAVDKEKFHAEFPADPRFDEVKTVWRFLGLHLTLSIQKHFQAFEKNKGNTVIIFDNEERERTRFTDLLLSPPPWTDTYYNRGKKQDALDQIVDAPYFADSRDVPLLQVADFVAYFLRRHAELEGGDGERYKQGRGRAGEALGLGCFGAVRPKGSNISKEGSMRMRAALLRIRPQGLLFVS